MSEGYETSIAGKPLSPESLMMGYAYRPEWSEGALKSPIFQTSTFAFRTAAEGKRYFALAYGLAEPEEGEECGLIYSRLNNPDLEILEDRLTLWDNAERGLVFASGMAAITTTLFANLRPGTALLHTAPLYGGTDHLVNETLPSWDVTSIEWSPGMTEDEVLERIAATGRPRAMVLMETPANPTNDLFCIATARRIADRLAGEDAPIPVAVDNTFLGPIWQHPLRHGADLVIYSATKYIGGHSDLIAGAVLGSDEWLRPIAEARTVMGTIATPLTGWLMMRSLETLDLRMRRQAENAQRIAAFLEDHPAVSRVSYLGLLDAGDAGHEIYKRQCEGPGAMISFWIEGGEAEAFAFLDALTLVHLAVSLGSTESLAEHPATMTHAGCDPVEKARLGINDSLIRLSVGVENVEDLILDLSNALSRGVSQ
jgi:methionine-gamma-lyase